MAHRAAPGGIGAQGGRVAGIADAARPRRRAVAAPPPRDHWARVNDNQNRLLKPSSSVATKGKLATGQKKFTVKESDLTGDKDLDQRVRDYVESLNDIVQERERYLMLKADGASAKELSGKFQSIKKMASDANKVWKVIHRQGATPQKVPPSFHKEPK